MCDENEVFYKIGKQNKYLLYEEALREMNATIEMHNLIYEFLNSISNGEDIEYKKHYNRISRVLRRVLIFNSDF